VASFIQRIFMVKHWNPLKSATH